LPACPVTVTSVTASANPTLPSYADLSITGVTNGCTSIAVKVDDVTYGFDVSATATINGGQWTAVVNHSKIRCNDEIVITPICVQEDGSTCSGALFPAKVVCSPCPNVKNLSASLSPGCAGEGNSVTATFTGTVSPAPPAGTAVSYLWDFGDNSTGSSTTPTVTHTYTSGGTYAVGVVVVSGSCTEQATLPVVIPTCSSGTGGGPGGSPGSSFCAALLIAAISLLLAASIALIIGICHTGISPVTAAGVIGAGVGLILLTLWAHFCSAITSCSLMETIYCFLFWIVAVIGPIATIVMGIIGDTACGLATAATWGGWGTIFAWYGTIMDAVHCPRKQCF
jgi:hypothetical protein